MESSVPSPPLPLPFWPGLSRKGFIGGSSSSSVSSSWMVVVSWTGVFHQGASGKVLGSVFTSATFSTTFVVGLHLSHPCNSLLALVLFGLLNPFGSDLALVPIWSTPSQQLVPQLLWVVLGEGQLLGWLSMCCSYKIYPSCLGENPSCLGENPLQKKNTTKPRDTFHVVANATSKVALLATLPACTRALVPPICLLSFSRLSRLCNLAINWCRLSRLSRLQSLHLLHLHLLHLLNLLDSCQSSPDMMKIAMHERNPQKKIFKHCQKKIGSS